MTQEKSAKTMGNMHCIFAHVFFQWFQFHLNATSCVRSRTCTLVCSVETAPRITVGLDLPKERNAFDPVQRFPNEHRAMSQARETHIFETRMVPVGQRN